MDILYVTRPIHPPWNEGSKNIVWQLATGLKRHTPHLLLSYKNHLQVANPNIVSHPIYSDHQLTFEQKIRLLNFLFFKMPPVDILHFFFVPTLFTSRLLSIVTQVHKKTAIQTIPCLPKTLSSRKNLKRFLFARHKVVYSRYTENLLYEYDISNITHINAGIDTNTHVNESRGADFLQRHDLFEDTLIVTFAGEYSRLGSTNLLRKILPELVAKCPHCHMVIACRIMGLKDIDEERNLKKFVETHHLAKQVHFVGQVDDFSSLLKASDMLVFAASEMNGKIDTPLTLLEAMANGLPIVSCDIPPLDEVFDGEKEFLVDKDNVPKLISTILSLVSNPQKRIEQGRRNRQRMLRKYDINTMVNRYEALYEALR